MQFIKQNILLVASAAVGVLALVGLVLGISQLMGFQDELNQAQRAMESVAGVLKGVPVSMPDNRTVNLIPTEKAVAAIQDLEKRYKARDLQVLASVLHENIGYNPETGTTKRKLILDGVFPAPVSAAVPYQFSARYKEAIQQLVAKLQCGEVPTDKELAQSREEVEQEFRLTGKDQRDKGSTTLVNAAASWTAQISQVAMDRVVGRRAKEIKVYCDPVRALDILPDLYTRTVGTPPAVEDMWWAQLSYWIQDDIVSAISAVNAPAKDVSESVVKRIEQIRVMHGYLVNTDGGRQFVGAEELSEAPESFTGLGSGKYLDVLKFGIQVVIDARQIPSFIDAMYRQGHYVLYMWSMESLPAPQVSQDGVGRSREWYGPGPVVRLKTWWEGCLVRDFYHWGIVNYAPDPSTGKTTVTLLDGKKRTLDSDERKGLPGLMPKRIRQALGSEPEDANEAEDGRGK